MRKTKKKNSKRSHSKSFVGYNSNQMKKISLRKNLDEKSNPFKQLVRKIQNKAPGKD